jgi:hypothetical protein
MLQHMHQQMRESVLVRQKQSSTTNPEQAIWDEHGTLIAKVPILRDVLSTHNQSPTARVYLHSHNTDFTFDFILLNFSPQRTSTCAAAEVWQHSAAMGMHAGKQASACVHTLQANRSNNGTFV